MPKCSVKLRAILARTALSVASVTTTSYVVAVDQSRREDADVRDAVELCPG
jgi:hypothetical protein